MGELRRRGEKTKCELRKYAKCKLAQIELFQKNVRFSAHNDVGAQ